MSDTPETDSAQMEGLLRTNPIPMQVVTANFARKLERERDEAKADAAALADKLSGLELRSTEELARLEQERNEARAKVERQAERIRQLEGATNHAGGTPLSIALKERDEAREQYDNLATEHMLAKGGRCPVCTPEQKCWECADDVSREAAK